MLKAEMKIKFYSKPEDPPDRIKYCIDPNRPLRPPFMLGGMLFSGSIITKESVLKTDEEYLVQVMFFTIDTPEVFSMIEDDLTIGSLHSIHVGKKVIGEAVLINYQYT